MAGARLTAARPLFVATIFAASFLLFLVQPMVARMALPRLGGAPNVWNSAMLVYQALLLAGYAYAHALAKRPLRTQAWVHGGLLALFALTLPIALYPLPPAAPGWEVLWVPLLLLLSIGPVFLVLSAQAPLMQRWYIADPQAREPWALYAASNLASFAGLLAYPLLMEPLLPLRQQSLVWSVGYALVIALVLVCAWQRRNADVPGPQAAQPASGPPIGWRRIALWLALSAVPSGLMLSTTTHLTTDIFAMPLLWVIPLGLYLLSFVIAFADRRLAARMISFIAPAVMLMAGGLTMISRGNGGMVLALASVLLLFVVAVALHARLYDSRPDAGRLTGFYLAMSVGGALGGAFTALIAPVLFDWVWEHPLLVLAAALLMPLPRALDWRRLPGLEPGMMKVGGGLVLAVTGFIAWQLYDLSPETDGLFAWLVLTGALVAVGLLLVPWRWLFAGALLMMMLAQGGVDTIEGTWKGQRMRSYFGVYTVLDYPSRQLRMLVHGTTLHGQQSTDPARRRQTMTYYGPGSGVALALEQAPALYGPGARVGVVGLGTGTLACLRTPGERWTFFELDPAVVTLSENGTFTFLRDCAPDAKIVLGDARLELEKAAPGSFDMLVIDAFSSDAIPLHLLTEEAIGVYMRALSPDGVLLIHISNRYIMLEPVLAALAKSHRLAARIRNDNPQDRALYTPSSWVSLARKPSQLAQLEKPRPDAPWDDLAWPTPHPWSDDRATILPQIQWGKLLGDL